MEFSSRFQLVLKVIIDSLGDWLEDIFTSTYICTGSADVTGSLNNVAVLNIPTVRTLFFVIFAFVALKSFFSLLYEVFDL